MSGPHGDHQGLEVVGMSVGPLQANTYLLLAAGEAVVVDPGAEGVRIGEELARRGKRLKAIWLTHAHFDHVGGVNDLLATCDPGTGATIPVYLHPADEPLLRNAAASAARYGLLIDQPAGPTSPLQHGDELTVGGVTARALHTPGHAPGHVAFYLEEHALLLSGDALFMGSIGRTDLPFGDHRQLIDSITRELLTLPDETRVLSGHGPATTIGTERYGNPFL